MKTLLSSNWIFMPYFVKQSFCFRRLCWFSNFRWLLIPTFPVRSTFWRLLFSRWILSSIFWPARPTINDWGPFFARFAIERTAIYEPGTYFLASIARLSGLTWFCKTYTNWLFFLVKIPADLYVFRWLGQWFYNGIQKYVFEQVNWYGPSSVKKGLIVCA